MPEFDANNEQGGEVDRLNGGFPAGPLEFERTKEIITRSVAKPLDVLDVGGGTGVYASWLADRGDQVRLVDPVPFHVEYARSADPRIRANVGDARKLSQTEESADIVLLLGPLYHLTESSDRLRALAEARRVLKPGGFLFAAGISRYAAMFDLLVRLGRLHEPHIFQAVRDAVDTGVFRGDVSNLFTTAYFHLPQEFADEIRRSSLELEALLNIEGPAFLLNDFQRSWTDPLKRDAILKIARLVESKQSCWQRRAISWR